MKTKYILYLLSLVFLLSSCWKEDLKNCWMGDVTLTIVAEKFQQPATDEGKLEENLSTRITVYVIISIKTTCLSIPESSITLPT